LSATKILKIQWKKLQMLPKQSNQKLTLLLLKPSMPPVTLLPSPLSLSLRMLCP
jgi:hypothetical protein